ATCATQLVFIVEYLVFKNEFGGRSIQKTRFNARHISVFERPFVLARRLNNRGRKTSVKHFEVRNPVAASEIFAPVFEILYVVSVPHNSKRIAIVKTHAHRSCGG